MKRLLAFSALVAFVVDQLSKWLVFSYLSLREVGRIDVLDPLLVFRPGLNKGMNFGLGGGGQSEIQRIVLVSVAFALCIALLVWALRSFTKRIAFVSAGFIIGGALANVFDRLLFTGVRDFLNMSCCGIDNPYLFNTGDIFIFAGAFGLILFTGEKAGDKPAGKNAADARDETR